MTLTLALLIASMAVNFASFLVIAHLLDQRRAAFDNTDEAGC